MKNSPIDTLGHRKLFPNGLIQPAGSFRFSADALLLASFIVPGQKERRLADLGTGCGVVALAALLRHPHITAVGIEREESLARAASENAAQLGLAARFCVVCRDLAEESNAERSTPHYPGDAECGVSRCPENAEKCALRCPGFTEPAPAPHSFDLVLANPPYRRPGHGREPASPLRRQAFFGEESLALFCSAAARLLQPKGRFGVIFPAPRLAELLETAAAHGHGPRRIMPVHPRADKPASLVLLETRKGAKADIVLMPPLILHEGHGPETRLTVAARTFCPELG